MRVQHLERRNTATRNPRVRPRTRPTTAAACPRCDHVQPVVQLLTHGVPSQLCVSGGVTPGALGCNTQTPRSGHTHTHTHTHAAAATIHARAHTRARARQCGRGQDPPKCLRYWKHSSTLRHACKSKTWLFDSDNTLRNLKVGSEPSSVLLPQPRPPMSTHGGPGARRCDRAWRRPAKTALRT